MSWTYNGEHIGYIRGSIKLVLDDSVSGTPTFVDSNEYTIPSTRYGIVHFPELFFGPQGSFNIHGATAPEITKYWYVMDSMYILPSTTIKLRSTTYNSRVLAREDGSAIVSIVVGSNVIDLFEFNYHAPSNQTTAAGMTVGVTTHDADEVTLV